MPFPQVVSLNICGDERGHLIAIEENRNVPFEIKRVYYVYGNRVGVARGYHAHKQLEQMLICVSGSCEILLDDGHEHERVLLDQPNHALYVGPMIWHEMHDFTSDAVLLVLASDYYDENDYIRDYEQFRSLVAAPVSNHNGVLGC